MSKEGEKSREQFWVESPEGAAFFIEQNLYDAADPDYALAVSVHETKGGSACNFWMNLKGVWYRVLPERFLEGEEPGPDLLEGEIIRLLQNREISAKVDEDFRLRMGIEGLTFLIESLIKKSTSG